MSENNTTLSHHNETTVATSSNTLGIMYLVTSLLVIVSNGVVMVVVVTSRELHLPTLWNIAFMALCDFCYGLHVLIFAVPSALMNQFAYSEALLEPASCIFTLLYGQNVLNIVVATFDRYLSVCWPLKYSQLMTAKRFTIAIVVTVAINVCRLCLMVVPNYDVSYYAEIAIPASKFNTFVVVLASVGLTAVSVLVIIGLLLRSICEMAQSRRRIHSLGGQARSHQFTVTISLSAGLFCLSYLPTCIIIIWNLISGLENVPTMILKFAMICLLSNTLWNVFIYAAVYRPFRDAFLKLFCKDYYKRRRQIEVQILAQNDESLTRRHENRDIVSCE